jgi:hypothetical protein
MSELSGTYSPFPCIVSGVVSTIAVDTWQLSCVVWQLKPSVAALTFPFGFLSFSHECADKSCFCIL